MAFFVEKSIMRDDAGKASNEGKRLWKNMNYLFMDTNGAVRGSTLERRIIGTGEKIFEIKRGKKKNDVWVPIEFVRFIYIFRGISLERQVFFLLGFYYGRLKLD